MFPKKIKKGTLFQTTKKLKPIGFDNQTVGIAEKAHIINDVAKAADVTTNTNLFGQRIAHRQRGKAQKRIRVIPNKFGTAQEPFKKTTKKATFKKAQTPYRKAKSKSVSKV